MGEAFNRGGERIAEAFGATKKEVFDKLSAAAPDAHEIRIRSLQEVPQQAEDMANMAQPEGPVYEDECLPGGPMRRPQISFARRKQLVRIGQEIAEQLQGKVKSHELCIIRQSAEMFLGRD